MSTTDHYLTPEEVAEFKKGILESYEDGSLCFVNEQGVTPFLTFYIHHPLKTLGYKDYDDEEGNPEIRRAVGEHFVKLLIQMHREFHEFVDEPYKLYWRDRTQTIKKVKKKEDVFDRVFDDYLKNAEDDTFFIAATCEESCADSPRWSFEAAFYSWWAALRFTRVKLHYRWSWLREHPHEWQAFVIKWLNLLKPFQCYAGFEVGTPLLDDGGYENNRAEFVLAREFLGLDVDHPREMGTHSLEDPTAHPLIHAGIVTGLRPVTWGCFLSDHWLAKLSKPKAVVQRELSAWAQVISCETGLWIQVGDLPQLYPIEDGVPEALTAINEYLKSILAKRIDLYTLTPWSDDPNSYFIDANTPEWIARFERDSNWPSQAIRDELRAKQME